MMLYLTVEFIATWLECAIGILIVTGLVTDREIEWRNTGIAAIVLSLMVLGCNQIKLLSFVATAIGVAGIALSVKAIYKVNIWDCIIFSIAYVLLIHIVDFFSMSIWSILLNNEQFGLYVIKQYSTWRIYHIIFTKAVMILLYSFVFRRFVISSQLWKRKLWIGTSVLGILVFYFGNITIKQSNEQQLMVWTFMMLVILFGGYCGRLYVNFDQSRRNLQFAEERNMMLANNYEHMINQYRNTQVMNHDLKNHYLVLQELIRKREYEKAEAYIDALEKEDYPSKTWTGIPILDILLEYKQYEASEQNIHFEILSDYIHLDLTEQEIVALFGNAVDNAIDACKRMKTGVKWVRIVIRKVNEMTFIKISNSIEAAPELKDDKFLSSKSKVKEYGWGMTSMQLIANKYGGTVDANFDNNQFALCIAFFA
ncbi:MAG: sensor histidine kinase [Monoglobales bacterium]